MGLTLPILHLESGVIPQRRGETGLVSPLLYNAPVGLGHLFQDVCCHLSGTGTLRLRQCDVRREFLMLQTLYDGSNAITSADIEVITLCRVPSHDNLRVCSQTRQDAQESQPFEVLRLVHDDERIIDRTTANVGSRGDSQLSPAHHRINFLLVGEDLQGIRDCKCPRKHLLFFRTRKET